jgi:hypothetical protein
MLSFGVEERAEERGWMVSRGSPDAENKIKIS